MAWDGHALLTDPLHLWDANAFYPERYSLAFSDSLLGYAPGHTVSWSDLETNNNNLAVWPEEGIVPTQPIQSMGQPAGASCLDGRQRQ